MNGLSFLQLRAANQARLPQFRNAQGQLSHTAQDVWSPADWMVATLGELGEAANIMKKIRRGDFAPGPELVEAKKKLGKEFADFITYADIMAMELDIDLGQAVQDKLNEISERVKSNVRLSERRGMYNAPEFLMHPGPGRPNARLSSDQLHAGLVVRYDSGQTAICMLVSPHVGGWHAEQYFGGLVFANPDRGFYALTEEEIVDCKTRASFCKP